MTKATKTTRLADAERELEYLMDDLHDLQWRIDRQRSRVEDIRREGTDEGVPHCASCGVVLETLSAANEGRCSQCVILKREPGVPYGLLDRGSHKRSGRR